MNCNVTSCEFNVRSIILLFFFKNNLLSENPLKYVMAEVRTEATKTKIRESYLVILM